jgi:hypothetical protein
MSSKCTVRAEQCATGEPCYLLLNPGALQGGYITALAAQWACRPRELDGINEAVHHKHHRDRKKPVVQDGRKRNEISN